MMRVLLPINLDRMMSPISELQRAIVRFNAGIQFYSFSSPVTDEDREEGGKIWDWTNLTKISLPELLLRRFDVCHHAAASRANFAACKGAKIRGHGGTRHLFTANCQPYPSHPRLQLLKKCVLSADHVISVSKAVALDFEKEVGRVSDGIIPNGFDEEFYSVKTDREGALNTVGLREKRPFVLYASTFIDRKRPEFFMDLAEAMPDVLCVMVGSDSVPEYTQRVKKRAACIRNIEFLGPVARARLRDLLQAASVLIWPSEYEGLPLTVVEALGAGCPVIAQPRSSLPEVITHGDNGWLYAAEESEPWLRKIREIMSWPPDTRARFCEVARQSVIGRFSWRTIGMRYGDFYRRIHKEAPRQGD